MFQELSLVSKVIVGVCIVANIFLVLRILYLQTKVVRGQKVSKPDGSCDDPEREPDFFAHAIADIIVICPAVLASVVLVCLGHRMGYYLLAIVSFSSVHIYLAQTATSVKFYKPTFNLAWLFVFPLNAVVGLIYVVWSVINFDMVFSPAEALELSLGSKILLYVFLAFFAFGAVVLWVWQAKVLSGQRVKNPGGDYDDWHVYPNQFGYALSDVFWLGPSLMIGVVLALFDCWFGYYWLALGSSVLIWCLGFMIFELRAHKPKITISWLFTFAIPVVIPLAYVVWTMLNFDIIFSR
jgi:hypothetical protein